MIRTFPALAAATLAAALIPTAAAAREVTATYNTRTQVYCITQIDRDDTDFAEPPIYRKPCRTAAQWRAHGIRFDKPAPAAALPIR